MGARTRARARLTRLVRRVVRQFRSLPFKLQLPLAAVAGLALWLAANGVYQVARKPSELLFPVSGTLYKTPRETWSEYQASFRAHATAVITPTLLAALAQVEGSGNPVALDPSPLRALPAGLERGRHVPDHRRHLPRGQALLHP
jgi:hypothetical protein